MNILKYLDELENEYQVTFEPELLQRIAWLKELLYLRKLYEKDLKNI